MPRTLLVESRPVPEDPPPEDDLDSVVLRRASGTPPPPDAPDLVVRRSAALLRGADRISIPRAGLTIGAGALAGIATAGPDGIRARVELTPAGTYVVVSTDENSSTYINGERLVPGERRPIGRGDALVVDGEPLHFLPGDDTGRLAPIRPVDAGRVRAGKQRFVIGRATESDLVLDHPTVSAEHAVIRQDGAAVVIEDRSSTTGVRVNGNAVRRAPLAAGDQIAIGPFRFVYDGEELVGRDAGGGLAVVAAGAYVQVESGTILHPAHLHLRPGELVAIIGASGAGKTTLLKLLSGATPPSGGRILAGGEDIAARQSEIGYVPQFDIVHGALSVREALDYAARLRLPPDMVADERVARVAEVMQQLGLSERADVRVERLSGGQRKRVAVGIELLHSPGALFLDEPTTGLDPGLERRMMELFRSVADGGRTVALVTHATASLRLCDRVVVMGEGGYTCFDGTPDAMLEAFEVEAFDDVYVELARQDPRQLAARRSAGESAIAPALPPVPTRLPQLPVRQTQLHQARVLAGRYATLLLRDRRHLRSAFVQVPILGLLTALLFKSGVFDRVGSGERPEVSAAKAAQLVFLMVTIAIWLGAINAAREIVKERSVLARELAVGVQLPAYLASKLVVLMVFALAQTLLFCLIVLVLRPLEEPSSIGLLLVAIMVLSSWVAVLMGLLVSAYSGSEDQATGVIPLLLVPQLLLGGAIVTLTEMPGAMQALAALIPARWSFAAAGHAIRMNNRIAEDPEFHRVSKYGPDFFGLSFTPFVFICLLFAGALCFALVRLLRPRTATP